MRQYYDKTVAYRQHKKMKRALPLTEFELILQGISDIDKTGHLFLVDIEFNKKNATEKQTFFNEIYTPIFEKKKVLSVNERSAFSAFRCNEIKR